MCINKYVNLTEGKGLYISTRLWLAALLHLMPEILVSNIVLRTDYFFLMCLMVFFSPSHVQNITSH